MLVFSLSNCQEEEVLNIENSVNNFNIEDARDFFNNNPIKIKQSLYFVGELKCNNGNFNNDKLYVPLFSKGSLSIKVVKNGKTEKYIFPFIAVTENKSNQSFNYNLKVYFSLKKETFNKETYHFYDNNNKLTVNKEKKVSKQALKTSKIAGCELWGYFLTNNDTGERTLIYTWWECSSGGSNGTPEQEAPDGGGGGGEGGNCPEGYIQDQNGSCVPNLIDPCITAKEISIATQSTTYLSAKASINSASANIEHSITLGKDVNGNITQAPMRSGGQNSVAVNTTWPGAFGALHNHPNNTQISGGDIYASIALNANNSNFTTSFIATDGEVYAAVVTDLAAAQAFVAAYPADHSPGYNPEFPDFIFNQLQVLVTPMGSSIEGKTAAIAFILDKYNAGITLLKQDSNGEFKPIKTLETTNSDGSKTYTTRTPCN